MSLSGNFEFDVFLSHSSKDKVEIRLIGERLRSDGLRVWFDEWEIKAGDSRSARTEQGLENSRVLLLCMSANAFGPDWKQLETDTFRFRDPLNLERIFIPLRLDEAPIKSSLAQFLYIDWSSKSERKREYAKLLQACRPPDRPLSAEGRIAHDQVPLTSTKLDVKGGTLVYVFSPDGERAVTGAEDAAVRVWDLKTGGCRLVLEGHEGKIFSLATSKDQKLAVSGDTNGIVRIWDLTTGRCLRVMSAHQGMICSIACSSGNRALTASEDRTLRLWDLETGVSLGALSGHAGWVWSVAWSPDQRSALSGSYDNTVRLWDLDTGNCLRVFEGHSAGIPCVAWSSDQLYFLSGSHDRTMRLWDVETGKCLRVFGGHTQEVFCVAWSADGRFALSGSWDKTVRLWEVFTGRCLCVFAGHTDPVRSVSWSDDQLLAFSGDSEGGARVWDLSKYIAEALASRDSEDASWQPEDQIKYTNAKVLLVGDSGVGKTSLSKRLALNEWGPSDSTIGAWATHWKLPVNHAEGVEREIWLWDFGGQADQRLIHQPYMEETAVAVLIFDGQRDDIFETLGHWNRYLTRLSPKEFSKLLVAGRVDAGGLRVSRNQIESFAKEHGFLGLFETSAKAGTGCQELRQAIIDCIKWEQIPWRSSPLRFKQVRDEIVGLKDTGRVLMRFKELRETLRLQFSDETHFVDEELKAVLNLLAGPGALWELKFGTWILLQPERVNAYAQAVIQTIRADEHERGCISETRILNGDLMYHSSMARLGADDERFVLLAMYQTLVETGLCLRESGDQGPLLVFPGYYRRERSHLGGDPPVLTSYQFTGSLDDVYATLVVRLHHVKAFELGDLWRYAADFLTPAGGKLSIKLIRKTEGSGELDLHCDPTIQTKDKAIFSKFVYEHVLQNGTNVVRLRQFICPHCNTLVSNREIAMRRLNDWIKSGEAEFGKPENAKYTTTDTGTPSIICLECEKRIPLWDEMEQCFATPEIQHIVQDLQRESAIVLRSEGNKRALVGEIISTVTLAGQLCREVAESSHGLDMEIEFRSDTGSATGRRLLLQLNSDDTYLRKRRNRAEIFEVVSSHAADFWRAQAFPVMLVVQSSDGEIRWMDVREYLRREPGNEPMKQIVFQGERFDVMSVSRWREAMLQGPLEVDDQSSLGFSDEKIRVDALRRLVATSRDNDTRDVLLDIIQNESSTAMRTVAAEALSKTWWNEFDVRNSLLATAAATSERGTRERLLHIAARAHDRVAGLWQSKLANQSSEQKEPEALPGYPAFRFTMFRLRNIGPFQDTGVVPLRRGVNVFLGDNAAGKTTILRCLSLAGIGLAAANEVEDNASAYLRKGSRRGSIEALLELVPDPGSTAGKPALFVVGLEISAGSSRFAPIADRDMTLPLLEPTAEGLPNSAEHLGALRSNSPSPFGFVSAYGSVRKFHRSPSVLQSELGKGENEWVRPLFDSEAPLVNPGVLSKFIRGDTSNIEDAPLAGLSQDVIGALRTSLGHLFPDVVTFFDDGDNDVQLDQMPFRFGELSDGYCSLFALIGHLLRCSMKVRNWKGDPTQIDGIALIDEIDLHLHPSWQQHVVQDFRKAFPNIQLIASTHSPLVVGEFKRDNVLIMRRNGDGSTTIDRPELDPQGLGVAGILTNMFDLGTTIDQPTLDKITRRLALHSARKEWSDEDKNEYEKLTNELAKLGFNQEFSDPYFERFANAMAKRHQAVVERLSPNEKVELDEYADRLLSEIMKSEDK